MCIRINGNSVMTFDQYCYCLEEILRFPEFSKNDNWIVSKSMKLLCFIREQNKNQIRFYKFVVYHTCIALQCVLLLEYWSSPVTEKQHSRAEEGSEMSSRDDWKSSFSRTTCISQLPLSSVSTQRVVAAASYRLLNNKFHSHSSVQSCLFV